MIELLKKLLEDKEFKDIFQPLSDEEAIDKGLMSYSKRKEINDQLKVAVEKRGGVVYTKMTSAGFSFLLKDLVPRSAVNLFIKHEIEPILTYYGLSSRDLYTDTSLVDAVQPQSRIGVVLPSSWKRYTYVSMSIHED